MTPDQFEALKRWVHRVAVAEVGARTYKNDRSIQDVQRKAAEAEMAARIAFEVEARV